MLKLEKIVKNYIVGESKVEALKGISLNFRKNEFVSILGPSGCGKTTLLNIIGGLDKYTSGDLVINGVSTKKFTDRDWDVYRNHRVGFIFQSYNLIPHQTILENVELALTIAGMTKEERVDKVKKALDRVGLQNQYNKKPNQLSGGQCQRVAIARALVNEPDILLADEPTGALDTVTSVQIMDLIKEISKEKLVIMVTHNPELAEKYSTRIVRLLDGEINNDTNVCKNDEESKEIYETNNEDKEKAKMSLLTAFRLSGKNLLSKFKRTLLVGIAGSIGIIGVSLVLALSGGIQNYIDTLQEDMLSGNPITISKTTYDINAMMGSMSNLEKTEIIIKADTVGVNSVMTELAKRAETMSSMFVSNDLTDEYIAYLNAMPKEYLETIKYDYGIDITNNLYTTFNEDDKVTSVSSIKQIYKAILSETEFSESSTLISTLSQPMGQAISNEEYLMKQYNLLDGKVATKKDEIMIVIDKNSQLTDLTLAQLGYYSEEEFLNMAYKAFEKISEEKYDPSKIKEEFSYQELMEKEFVLFPNDSIYNRSINPLTPFTYNYKLNKNDDSGLKLKVVGILQPKVEVNFGSLSTGFYYTEELTEYMLQQNKNSEMTNYLKDDAKHSITSTAITNDGVTISTGVTYEFEYLSQGKEIKKQTGYVGTVSLMSMMSGMLGGMLGGGSTGSSSPSLSNDIYTLDLRDIAGDSSVSGISIYPVDFELKQHVLEYLDAWDENGDITVTYEQEQEDGTFKTITKTLTKDDRSDITYNDTLSIVIDMIDTMITVVTTALIAFTAISLVVSTVMIGIITYVSVVERTKEIGVIRSLGGRKKDVAHLFNAETIIIGLVAGLIGIGVTYLISIIANIIIGQLTGIYTLVALPWYQALIMITISVFLTWISGLFPSRSAAKMDPVNALRTE